MSAGRPSNAASTSAEGGTCCRARRRRRRSARHALRRRKKTPESAPAAAAAAWFAEPLEAARGGGDIVWLAWAAGARTVGIDEAWEEGAERKVWEGAAKVVGKVCEGIRELPPVADDDGVVLPVGVAVLLTVEEGFVRVAVLLLGVGEGEGV
jgi:hypothetical protein